jgi:hypothetical protein
VGYAGRELTARRLRVPIDPHDTPTLGTHHPLGGDTSADTRSAAILFPWQAAFVVTMQGRVGNQAGRLRTAGSPYWIAIIPQIARP